ncbi:hypothetical protein DASC09_041850 [Saccharomycopsis crataegensis]|uniref:Uncharacterized protein n=1 Tax=Saccharomycopsis crataegensis TaxID=43959 RepID=A0AAV5QRF6_9ASCO|nr:hypothetical protein DASC09_041850 [Saccharomycopsis crataegensis]
MEILGELQIESLPNVFKNIEKVELRNLIADEHSPQLLYYIVSALFQRIFVLGGTIDTFPTEWKLPNLESLIIYDSSRIVIVTASSINSLNFPKIERFEISEEIVSDFLSHMDSEN